MRIQGLFRDYKGRYTGVIGITSGYMTNDGNFTCYCHSLSNQGTES